jgi:hypothetical protein
MSGRTTIGVQAIRAYVMGIEYFLGGTGPELDSPNLAGCPTNLARNPTPGLRLDLRLRHTPKPIAHVVHSCPLKEQFYITGFQKCLQRRIYKSFGVLVLRPAHRVSFRAVAQQSPGPGATAGMNSAAPHVAQQCSLGVGVVRDSLADQGVDAVIVSNPSRIV